MNSHFEECMRKMRTKDQCLAELQLQAQQPRLAAKEDEKQDIKTHERTEGAAVDDKKYGDISSARVYDNLTSLASFGNYPSLQFSLNTLIMIWSTKAPKRQCRVSPPWKCAR